MSVLVESASNLKQRINQLQAQHSTELENLYAHQATRYLDDALDRYLAQNEEADSGYAQAIDVRLFPDFPVKHDLIKFALRSCMIVLVAAGRD